MSGGRLKYIETMTLLKLMQCSDAVLEDHALYFFKTILFTVHITNIIISVLRNIITGVVKTGETS